MRYTNIPLCLLIFGLLVAIYDCGPTPPTTEPTTEQPKPEPTTTESNQPEPISTPDEKQTRPTESHGVVEQTREMTREPQSEPTRQPDASTTDSPQRPPETISNDNQSPDNQPIEQITKPPYTVSVCKDSWHGALLATAIYPSESIKDLPSAYKHQKTIQGNNADGTMMFFTSRAPHTLCHVVFKGVSPQSTKDLYASLSSVKTTSCQTTNGTKLGSCGSGFYNQYKALRNAGAITYIESWTKKGKCPGGLWLYGHSMGGTEASLLAAELQTTSPKRYTKQYMAVFTYGSPRLFEEKEANAFHKSINAFRWINEGDPIPSVPPSKLGFRHFGKAYKIKRNNGNLKFNTANQDESPSIDLLNATHAHKYSTYANRLEKCTGL
jgi:hypothetical protein